MDEFKKYMQQQANAFDVEEPSNKVWPQIEQQCKPVKRINSVKKIAVWLVAACILVIAGTLVWLVANKPANTTTAVVVSHQKYQQVAATALNSSLKPIKKNSQVSDFVKTTSFPKAKKTPNGINRKGFDNNNELNNTVIVALHDIEHSFSQVIDLQRDKVNRIPLYAEKPSYFNDFKLQLKQMEKDEQAIKKEINAHGLNNELLNQLINIYQQKLNVLKQLQTEINKTNNRFKQNSSPVTQTNTYFLNI